MIIRGGENIFAREIEDYLDTHKSILESQVSQNLGQKTIVILILLLFPLQIIGVPDERMGEELCAYLRLQPGVTTLSKEEIKKFCHGVLAHFKVPRYIRIVDDFPKTTSGKIQKFKLQQMFKKLEGE